MAETEFTVRAALLCAQHRRQMRRLRPDPAISMELGLRPPSLRELLRIVQDMTAPRYLPYTKYHWS